MEKKPIGCIIQARMRSSRFPKKVMREIYDDEGYKKSSKEDLKFK